MGDQLEVLGLIPARSGSEGLPGKHLKDLLGKPLIAYTIGAALEAPSVSRVVVSTDDRETARLAESLRAEVPFLRPPELAEEGVPMLPVVRHALEALEEQGYRPEVVVLLQPTTPLRRAEHIEAAVRLLIESGADSVVSLCPARPNPFWLRVIEGNRVERFLDSDLSTGQRQDLPRVYQVNGAIYATRVPVVREGSLYGNDVRALIMPPEESVDIDTELDFKIAEMLLRERIGRG